MSRTKPTEAHRPKKCSKATSATAATLRKNGATDNASALNNAIEVSKSSPDMQINLTACPSVHDATTHTIERTKTVDCAHTQRKV
jgi:hypothetical protein